MNIGRSEVIVYPPSEDGPPYTLVASGGSGAAVRVAQIVTGEEGDTPPPDSGKHPAAAMPERRTERWRKPAR